jgi:hypothetical protein
MEVSAFMDFIIPLFYCYEIGSSIVSGSGVRIPSFATLNFELPLISLCSIASGLLLLAFICWLGFRSVILFLLIYCLEVELFAV